MMSVIEVILGLFGKDKGDSSKNMLIIIVGLMVIIPSLYLLYSGISNGVKSIFNIRSDKEIIYDQKTLIDSVVKVNKEAHDTLELTIKTNEVDINTTVSLYKEVSILEDMVKDSISKTKHIDKHTEKVLQQKVVELNKNTEYASIKKDIIIDSDKYIMKGVHNYDIISDMFDKVDGL